MILRRIVLLLLLLTVPFQAAVGSTGFVCGHGVQHAGADAFAEKAHASHSLAHEHDRVTHRHGESHVGLKHVHAADMQGGHSRGSHAFGAPSSASDVAHFDLGVAGSDTDNDAGTCSLCSECSFSAAPVSASAPDAAIPPAALKVSSYVDPAAPRDAGDALFRPPRSLGR